MMARPLAGPHIARIDRATLSMVNAAGIGTGIIAVTFDGTLAAEQAARHSSQPEQRGCPSKRGKC